MRADDEHSETQAGDPRVGHAGPQYLRAVVEGGRREESNDDDYDDDPTTTVMPQQNEHLPDTLQRQDTLTDRVAEEQRPRMQRPHTATTEDTEPIRRPRRGQDAVATTTINTDDPPEVGRPYTTIEIDARRR